MSVFEKLEERATGMCRPDEFERRPMVVKFTDEATTRVDPHGVATREEFELILQLKCRYWANKAERVHAQKNAVRTMAHTLYADVLSQLNGIRHAVYDGDRVAALNRICELESSLTR